MTASWTRPVTVPVGELWPTGLLRRRAVRGSVNIHKTSVKARSFPPYTLERLMATLSAWKFNSLRGDDEVLPKPEKLNRPSAINLRDEAVVSGESAGRSRRPSSPLDGGSAKAPASMSSVRDESVPAAPAWVFPVPLSARERWLLIWEIIVVFAVSLGLSAVRSLVLLIGSLTAPKASARST